MGGLVKMDSRLEHAAPVLGQTLGVYEEWLPASPLRASFSCRWVHAISDASAPPALIVPDGCVDLIWFNGELRVAGPDRRAKIECIPSGATVVGFRFRPGVAREWLRVPLSEIVGERTALENFWGAEARRLSDWVSEGRDAHAVAQRIEAAPSLRAQREGPANQSAVQVYGITHRYRGINESLVRSLRLRLGMSERTLRRRCNDVFGYGPKTLHRILRFQRFLQLARKSSISESARLALAAGYADQAHMTRETRDLAGLSPRSIIRQLAC